MADAAAIAYMRHLASQRDDLAELAREMLATFTKTSDGHRARVGQVQIAKWQKRLEGATGD